MRKLEFLFHAVAKRFIAKFGKPGTGTTILSLFEDLVDMLFESLFVTEKSRCPSESINLLDFHIIKAEAEATISFKQQRPALFNTVLEDTSSLSLVRLLVLAALYSAKFKWDSTFNR